MPAHAGI